MKQFSPTYYYQWAFKKNLMDLSIPQNTTGPVLSAFKVIKYHKCIL